MDENRKHRREQEKLAEAAEAQHAAHGGDFVPDALLVRRRRRRRESPPPVSLDGRLLAPGRRLLLGPRVREGLLNV